VAPLEPGRLCVLFQAQEGHFAVEASSVAEIATPDHDGRAIRGVVELVDLCRLLGGREDEARPGMGLVLDTSPTLGVRVRRIIEIADVAKAPFFQLPARAQRALPGVRGAVLFKERLFLELGPEALAQVRPASALEPRAQPKAIFFAEAPDRALVFESEDRLFGIPLALVSQVVNMGGGFCPLDVSEASVLGILPHAQGIWPLYSPSGLMGRPGRVEPLCILTELAGQNVALTARRVVGIRERFVRGESEGEFSCAGGEGAVVFLNLEHMFS
jgi:chemotaxis signal transduction protein